VSEEGEGERERECERESGRDRERERERVREREIKEILFQQQCKLCSQCKAIIYGSGGYPTSGKKQHFSPRFFTHSWPDS